MVLFNMLPNHSSIVYAETKLVEIGKSHKQSKTAVQAKDYI